MQFKTKWEAVCPSCRWMFETYRKPTPGTVCSVCRNDPTWKDRGGLLGGYERLEFPPYERIERVDPLPEPITVKPSKVDIIIPDPERRLREQARLAKVMEAWDNVA